MCKRLIVNSVLSVNILLTGATGYIGRRLLPVLVEQGHTVYCLVRDKQRFRFEKSLFESVIVLEGDLSKPETLSCIPEKIDAAYYLVHSLGNAYRDFHSLEEACATHFIEKIKTTRARQVIYLGGIANAEDLSPHLESRKSVEAILGSSEVPLTVLRAAIIIGSGGASFEIIRDLIEKLPVMIAPKWVNTRCQPIGISNVVEYLTGVLFNEKTYDRVFDIGGPEVLTYKEMLLQFAEVRGLKRWIVTVPVLTPRLSSYWLFFVTSTSYALAQNLVDSMVNEVIAKKSDLEKIVPLELLGYKEAIRVAFDKIEHNEVVSSWVDAMNQGIIQHQLSDYIKVPEHGCFVDKQVFALKDFGKTDAEVLSNVWAIGGKRGWYKWDVLWMIRGLLDKAVGGVGRRRGRRSPNDLVPGDALDFWRVLDANKEEKRLLLYAEMKLPGEAWLEFKIKDGTFYQTATFRPNGLGGRFYWYILYPFHVFIFAGMGRNIIQFEKPL